MSAETKIVAYLDILGFSNYCKENIDIPSNLLWASNDVLNEKMKLAQAKDKSEAPKDIINQQEFSSAEYFLPLSDSIFIIASVKDADLFVVQFSNYLNAIFNRIKDTLSECIFSLFDNTLDTVYTS